MIDPSLSRITCKNIYSRSSALLCVKSDIKIFLQINMINELKLSDSRDWQTISGQVLSRNQIPLEVHTQKVEKYNKGLIYCLKIRGAHTLPQPPAPTPSGAAYVTALLLQIEKKNKWSRCHGNQWSIVWEAIHATITQSHQSRELAMPCIQHCFQIPSIFSNQCDNHIHMIQVLPPIHIMWPNCF